MSIFKDIIFWTFLIALAFLCGRLIVALFVGLLKLWDNKFGDPNKILLGKERYLKQIAVVKTKFEKEKRSNLPQGLVNVKGELWRAELIDQKDEPPNPTDKVKIIGMKGLILEVEPLEKG